jgi:hypothetical protein
MTCLTAMVYLFKNDYRYVPLVVNTSWSFPHSWLIIGFVTRLTRRMPLEHWIKISDCSNPESFQILADEIVNSSMVMSRDFTKKRLKMLSIKSWMDDDLLKMYYTLCNMLCWNITTQIIKFYSIDVYFLIWQIFEWQFSQTLLITQYLYVWL